MNATLTPYQWLRVVREATGVNVRLRPFDEVLRVACDDACFRVLIRTYRVNPQRTQTRLEKSGVRLIVVKRDDNLWTTGEMTLWDQDSCVRIIREIGKGCTPEEYFKRREHENLAHRWGTSRRPMDSYQRQCQGY